MTPLKYIKKDTIENLVKWLNSNNVSKDDIVTIIKSGDSFYAICKDWYNHKFDD